MSCGQDSIAAIDCHVKQENQKATIHSLLCKVINPSDICNSTMLQMRTKSLDSNDEHLGCRAFRNTPREPEVKIEKVGGG